MNQDFALTATPAIARRLLAVRDVCQMDIPPEIITLAAQDRLDPAIFDPLVCPYNDTRYNIAQFLLDSDLRGVIQTAYHPEITPLALLTITKSTSQGHLLVLPHNLHRRPWMAAGIASGVMTAMQSLHWVMDHLGEIDRHTTLIVVVNQSTPDHRIETYHLRTLVREFPHLIIYDDSAEDDVMPWPVWAHILCPSMPHPLLPRLLKDGRSDWAQRPLASFAILYGVAIFPDLITEPMIRGLLDDAFLISRLGSYLGILKD